MSDWLPERLPEDIDCERSFLATCCAPGAGYVASEAVVGLSADDFVHPSHKAVFSALVALIARNEEVNSLTLKVELEAADALGRVGGYPGLVELLAGEDVERPHVLANVILEKSRLRKLVHMGAGLVRMAVEGQESSGLVESFSASLLTMAQPTGSKGLMRLGEFGETAMRHALDVAEGRQTPGTPTGFSRLDWMLGGGFKPQQMVILAARPSVGKSTLLAQWLRRISEHSATAALFGLEMAGDEVWIRAAASESRVSGGKISSGTLDASEWARLRDAQGALAALPFLVCDRATITVPEIRSMSERASVKFGKLGLVAVDYLQLLSSPRGSQAAKQNESVRVGEISRGFKLMAKDLDVPALVLSQLNREVEHRSGGRPQLSDLRDSGALEQDADVVLFLHRRGEAGAPDAAYELIVAKNRNGPTGSSPSRPTSSTTASSKCPA